MKYIQIFIALLFAISFVSAASFVSPDSINIINGNYEFRIKAAFEDIEKCTIIAVSEGAKDSDTFMIYGESQDTKYASGRFDTTSIKDASDWVFKGTCSYKDSSKEPIEPIDRVTIDNTKPELQVIMPFDEEGEYWDFMCVAANEASIKIGGTEYFMNKEGAICRFYTDEAPEGAFDILVKISDGKDTQTLTFQNVDKNQLRDPLVLQQFLESQAEESVEDDYDKNAPHWPLVLSVAFILVVIYVVSRKKE